MQTFISEDDLLVALIFMEYSFYIIMIFFSKHQDYWYINGTFTGFLSEENDFLKLTENAENAFCRPETWYTLVTVIEIT